MTDPKEVFSGGVDQYGNPWAITDDGLEFVDGSTGEAVRIDLETIVDEVVGRTFRELLQQAADGYWSGGGELQ